MICESYRDELFQKRSNILEAEQEKNTGNTGPVLNDWLRDRRDLCNMFNSLWELGLWCKLSEQGGSIQSGGENDDM